MNEAPTFIRTIENRQHFDTRQPQLRHEKCGLAAEYGTDLQKRVGGNEFGSTRVSAQNGVAAQPRGE
jgi:hypothetical protein